MPVVTVITSTTATVNLADSEGVYVPDHVSVGGSGVSAGIIGAGTQHDALIEGNVLGFSFGVMLTTQAGTRSDVWIGTNASVGGSGGALYLEGGSFDVTIEGDLTCSAAGALYLRQVAGETAAVMNAGRIVAGNVAVLCNEPTYTGGLRLINTGLIWGGTQAVHANYGDGGVTEVINRGTMIGGVLLGAGNDRFDGRGGTVDGAINGNAGADTFLPGAGAERINGGAGIDTLDFRSTGAVQIALDASFANTGRAAGDTYLALEAVNGSMSGADRIAGNGFANTLRGFGGGDTLFGRGGNDSLQGGAGLDRLVGGAGNDAFVFLARSDSGDTITDFTNAAGNNDQIRIEGSAFGLGAATGVLSAGRFRARADNLAQDADDRFIFRTTDQTLWFDENGSAAGGLTLLADLQSTATMTAADIILI